MTWAARCRTAAARELGDEDDHERDHDDGATDTHADADALLPQLGGAPLGGALLVLGPALGFRLALTGH